MTADANAAKLYPDLMLVELVTRQDCLVLDRGPGVLGDGGNSGMQALNLVVQWGVRRVVLVGFDMRLDRGSHWHGNHVRGLSNPGQTALARWRRSMETAAAQLAPLGVEVLNTSRESALWGFRKCSLEDALY